MSVLNPELKILKWEFADLGKRVEKHISEGTPEPLFMANVDQNRSMFTVTRDGQRFLLMSLMDRDASPLVTVLNWRSLVRD